MRLLTDEEGARAVTDEGEIRPQKPIISVYGDMDWTQIDGVNYVVIGYQGEISKFATNSEGKKILDDKGNPVIIWKPHWVCKLIGPGGAVIEDFWHKFSKVANIIIKQPASEGVLHVYDGTEPEEHDDIRTLFLAVRDVLSRYVTFQSNGDLSTMVCFVVAAHFYPVFSHFGPIIIGKAGYNSGGSTLLLAAGCLMPRPVFVVDLTEASLFRITDEAHCSLLLDELRMDMDRKTLSAIALLLDASFMKGTSIPRASGKNFQIEYFHVFGPKLTVDAEEVLNRSSSLSRCVRICLVNDPTKNFRLNPRDFVREHLPVIRRLYASYPRFAHAVWDEYQRITEYTGREQQAYAPIAAIARLAGVEDQVRKTLLFNSGFVDAIRNLNDVPRLILSELGQYLAEVLEDVRCSREVSGWSIADGFAIRFTTLHEKLKKRLEEEFQRDILIDGNGNTQERLWKRLPYQVDEQMQKGRLLQLIKSIIPEHVGKKYKGDRHVYVQFTNTNELINTINRINVVIGSDKNDRDRPDTNPSENRNRDDPGDGNNSNQSIPQTGSDSTTFHSDSTHVESTSSVSSNPQKRESHDMDKEKEGKSSNGLPLGNVDFVESEQCQQANFSIPQGIPHSTDCGEQHKPMGRTANAAQKPIDRLCTLLLSGKGINEVLGFLSSAGLHPDPKSSPTILGRLYELHASEGQLVDLIARIENGEGTNPGGNQGDGSSPASNVTQPTMGDDILRDQFLKVLVSYRRVVEDRARQCGVSTPFDLPDTVKRELIRRYLA